jgi:hypothetical protein
MTASDWSGFSADFVDFSFGGSDFCATVADDGKLISKAAVSDKKRKREVIGIAECTGDLQFID